MAKIKGYIKADDTHQALTERKKAITSLKSLIWERNAAEFNRKLQPFLLDFWSYTQLISYLCISCFNNDNFKRWAKAYQPAIYTNAETNNYIESWDNRLKTIE
ncbi:hypothetical protein BCV72DRAFT_118659 [Rhizopus microsporus var. microsporus]|uniref:Uncharacterized protein n=1 Tax=Rhizopus microsporus var. microsporus TaxID=86635 RepID=A0A1X0R464_RHIZD|nr:hypothetical protein BCV72DRAFT_118659 [Rhizopus microsporus var. microsporus]